MVQLQNFFFFITFMVVPRGTAAPVLFQWFVSRDVSTGAPFSNGTIIPILISAFSFIVYLHGRKFIRSTDGFTLSDPPAFSLCTVLISQTKPLRHLETRIGRTLATRSPYFLILHFLILEYMWDWDLSYLSSFCGVLILILFFINFVDQSRLQRRKVCGGQVRRRRGKREALPPFYPLLSPCDLPIPRSRLLTKFHLSHVGVCILILGVLLSKYKLSFTQRLPLGSELHLGKEVCCLRGIDHLHGPNSHSICGNFLIKKPNNNLLKERKLIMFPEKRYFDAIHERTSTTEVAIHTNPFTDLYALIGTGSSTTGGWYTTIMKLPFIFCIWIGFLLASAGGSRSLSRQLHKDLLHWNR
nr:cytochrome c biogenesis FC [Acorus tatarinowii]